MSAPGQLRHQVLTPATGPGRRPALRGRRFGFDFLDFKAFFGTVFRTASGAAGIRRGRSVLGPHREAAYSDGRHFWNRGLSVILGMVVGPSICQLLFKTKKKIETARSQWDRGDDRPSAAECWPRPRSCLGPDAPPLREAVTTRATNETN